MSYYVVDHPHGNKRVYNPEVAGWYKAAGFPVYKNES